MICEGETKISNVHLQRGLGSGTGKGKCADTQGGAQRRILKPRGLKLKIKHQTRQHVVVDGISTPTPVSALSITIHTPFRLNAPESKTTRGGHLLYTPP